MVVKLLKGGEWREPYYLKNEVRRAWQRYKMLSSRWNEPINQSLERLKDDLIGSINDESYLASTPDIMKGKIEQIANALPYIRPGRCKR